MRRPPSQGTLELIDFLYEDAYGKSIEEEKKELRAQLEKERTERERLELERAERERTERLERERAERERLERFEHDTKSIKKLYFDKKWEVQEIADFLEVSVARVEETIRNDNKK
jgi:SMC interacting uncharacterized protein involved in chromosome segregation